MTDKDPPPIKRVIPRPEVLKPQHALSETPPPVDADDYDFEAMFASAPPRAAPPSRSPEEEFFENDPEAQKALSDPPPPPSSGGGFWSHAAEGSANAEDVAASGAAPEGDASPVPALNRPSGELIDDLLEDEPDSAVPLPLERRSEPPERTSTPWSVVPPSRGGLGQVPALQSLQAEPQPSLLGSALTEPFPLAESAEAPRVTRPSDPTLPPPSSVVSAASAPALSGVEELERQGGLAEWKTRAEWLAREAKSQKDSKQQARTLLVASELFAMVGDSVQARSCADAATKLSTGIAQRQARQLALAAQDYRAASGVLSAEAHAAATPEARAHAAFLNAEVERINLADNAASLRHFEQGSRATPSDPRGVMARLCSQLAMGPKPPSIRWPEGGSFQVLELATRALSLLRGDTRWPSAELVPITPAVAFVDAQRALERGDRVKAAKSLERLATVDGFERSAKWLAAALLAPVAATRSDSMRLLTEMLSGRDDPALRRTLAARAVEAGNAEVARVALERAAAGGGSDSPFSAVERLAIGALSGADVSSLEPWLSEAAEKDELKPLVFALSSVLGREVSQPSADQDVASILRLARAVADGLPPAVILEKLSDAPRGVHPLLSLLELEQAAACGDVDALCKALLRWPGETNEEQSASAQYVAGFLYEKAGQKETAAAHYAEAVGSPAFSEAAVRARVSFSVPGSASEPLFAELAETKKNPTERALLSLEAALHADSEQAQLALLQRSHDAAPDLPFAAHLGERLGLRDEHAESAIGWLGLVRERTDDAYEQALLLTREALLSSGDLDQARALLDAAWERWPKDIALHELQERLNTAEPAAKAATREQLAKGAIDPVSKGRLLLEAAWLHEQAGAARDAARAARLASPFEPELSALAFERNAPGTPEASALKETWVRALAAEPSQEFRVDACLRLADFEHLAGSPAAQRKWLNEALRHDPESLPALLQLEQLAFNGEAADDLAATEETLANRLSPQDALAHTLLWARLEREQKGWPTAFEGLKLAERGPDTSLFVARQLQAHARRAGDEQRCYDATVLITGKLSQPLDQAISHLRASESATLLGRPALALSHLTQAAELAPQHLVVLSRLAELLLEQGALAEAAASFERLAAASRVPAHRVSAWFQAAKLWLDDLQDEPRGLGCLKRAAELDASHTEVFERLLALQLTYNKFEEIVALIERRLEVVEDEAARGVLRLQQGRAYMRLGQTQAARASLKSALEANPDHPEALDTLAELSLTEGDANATEQALLQLVRLNNDSATQADVYMKLADLYAQQLDNPERAERCYQEVLKRRPNDALAFERLLPLYQQLSSPQRAAELLNERLAIATDFQQRRELHLALVRAYDEYEGDTLAAERTLNAALGQWPFDRDVLRCAGQFYSSHSLDGPLRVLIRRTQAEIERKLQSGLLSAEFTGAIQTLASISGEGPREELAAAATRALHGEPATIGARGTKALARQLDESTAPPLIGSALRALLVHTRGMFDDTFPLDTTRYEPRTLPAGELLSSFESKARGAGLVVPEVLITSVDTKQWALGGGARPQVVLGEDWLRQPTPIQDFVVWRSLKLIQAKACAFTRLEGEELVAAILAYLSCFVAVGDDRITNRSLFDSMRARLVAHLPSELSDDTPVLALEVLGQVAEQAASLGPSARKWANRTALLATGDLSAALSALAVSYGLDALSSDSQQRVAWLAGNPETRDLISACVGTSFLEAYSIA